MNSMSFITNTVSLTEQDALVHMSLHKTRILSTHYLEPTRISTTNVTLTRGQEHKESLENLNGAYAYILCGIRVTGSTSTNDGHSQFVSLGPRGSIDIKSSGNSSLLGSGTPVPERFLRTILAQRHYPNSDLYSCKALHMTPLTDNARMADVGGRSGCYYFSSERAHLCLTPDAAALSIRCI